MPEERYNLLHHAGRNAEERIRSRHRNSGSPHADHVVHEGNANDAVRHITNVSGSADHTRIPSPYRTSLLNQDQLQGAVHPANPAAKVQGGRR
jgi:hypothetical protein